MTSEGRTQVGRKLSGIFGGVSGGLGTFGALHNVCHYTCQIIVAGLGIAGITLAGLPLAFLEDPRLIVFFGGMGSVSLGVSTILHVKAKRWSFRTAGLRGLLDRRTVILLSVLLLSGWSVMQGAAQMTRVAAPRDAPTPTNKDGSVEVELTLLNLTDPSLKDALVFILVKRSGKRTMPAHPAERVWIANIISTVLSEHADRFGADLDRWLLLTGEKRRSTVSPAMAHRRPLRKKFLHGSGFILADREAWIQRYDRFNDVKATRYLAKGVKTLSGKTDPSPFVGAQEG